MRLGVDLGGSKIEIAGFGDDGAMLLRERVATPRGDYVGTLKAVAAFRAEQGDYVVSDAALLKALAAPGEHGLVFTLVAGADGDLLDGTLVTGGAGTAAAADDHGHDPGDGHGHELERAAWIGGGTAALGLIGSIAWWRQRRRHAGQQQGGL